MVEPLNGKDELGLWRRWRSAAASSSAGAEIDALTLAAYAEDRLLPETIGAVEEWLAANPDAVADVLAARRAARQALPEAPAAVAARAAALVEMGDAQVLSFRPQARMRSWRVAVRWGAMAASIVIVSFVGFALGNEAYVSLAGGAPLTFSQELLDPPAGLFNNADEDGST